MRIARVLSNLVFCFALILSVGCHSDTTANGLPYIELAKKLVGDYGLTLIPSECLAFENVGSAQNFKAVIDVREVHNENCPGDIQTSPKLFSIAFDKDNRVWSDAKSLLGQLEKLE